MDKLEWNRKKATLVSGVSVTLLSLPCVFGYNIWSGIQLLGEGSSVLDFEDFIVSNNLLPLGSLAFILFVTSKNGWGFERFRAEVNSGKGLKMPGGKAIQFYMSYIIPLIIAAIYFGGYYGMFKPAEGQPYDAHFFAWMAVSVLFFAFIVFVAVWGGRKRAEKN